MSRGIKFRVWDKDLCLYVSGAEFGLARMSIRPDEDDGRIFSFDTLFPGRYSWEQSTGLKDKSGKEIYEGDIVKTNSPDRANFNAGAIVMQQQMYLIINTPTYGDARLSHSEPLGYYCDMECEIIGNIHENQELLEDK